ncbi:subtilisin-like protein, partial [Anaeromyces robustus]
MKNSKPHKTVISMSFGGFGYVKALEDKLNEAINEGYIIFVSAGNDNINACEPKNSKDFKTYSGYRKVIAVGATTSNLYGDGIYRANYSNYGECVDIFAPADTLCAQTTKGYKGVKKGGGTSSATPVVAGVAATIMSEFSNIEF